MGYDVMMIVCRRIEGQKILGCDVTIHLVLSGYRWKLR